MEHLEKEIAVCDAVSIGEYKDGRSGEIREHFANADLYGRRELYIQTIFDNGGGRTNPLGYIAQIFADTTGYPKGGDVALGPGACAYESKPTLVRVEAYVRTRSVVTEQFGICRA